MNLLLFNIKTYLSIMQTICVALAGFGISCDSQTGSNEQIQSAFNEHMADFGLSFGTTEEYNFRLNLYSKVD